MSDLERGEKTPLLGDTVLIRCRLPFIVTCTMLVLLLRLAGLSMFVTWAGDCFIREFKTTALCEEFSLFPLPEVFASVRLVFYAITSFLFILHIRSLNHFPGFRLILKHLKWKKYFWTLLFILVLVCVYAILIMIKEQEKLKILLYICYIFEKSLGVALVLCLNFLSSDKMKSGLKYWVYIVVFVVYALENYTMFILFSATAVYNVVSVPHTGIKDTPDITEVTSLMLLITSNGLRYYLADFFSSKCFDQDVDILGGGTKSITESLGLPATVGQARGGEESADPRKINYKASDRKTISL